MTSSSAMHLPSLPSEIWSQTVSWLPRPQQKTLLEVSHFFHDITLPFVFSAIKLYLLSGFEVLEMLDTNNEAFAAEVEQLLMRRSWEILDRITNDTQFARVVKDITVVIYTDSQATFEILTLSKAFSALKNLRTVRCYGANFTLLEQVVRAVPSTIQHILYPTSINLDVLDGLPNLNRLEYRNTSYFPADGACDILPLPWRVSSPLPGLHFTPSLHNRLHVLSINATWIDRIPVWVYNNLTILEINSESSKDPISLDFVCHHSPLLEELSLIGYVHPATCFSLPEDPTTLPKLHSLRLSCEYVIAGAPLIDAQLITVANFIRAHNNLRRLYLRFPGARWFDFRYLLPDIKPLHNLEVFGFHTGVDDLDEEALEFLTEHLPISLKALHLAMRWDSNPGNHVSCLMNTLAQMPRLSFLHLYAVDAHLPFTRDDLAVELRNLTMVGLTRALWDISRTGPEVEVLKWPRWKTKFFVESDFHNHDDAWLFKYH